MVKIQEKVFEKYANCTNCGANAMHQQHVIGVYVTIYECGTWHCIDSDKPNEPHIELACKSQAAKRCAFCGFTLNSKGECAKCI